MSTPEATPAGRESASSVGAGPLRRWLALLLLTVGVAMVHLLLAGRVADSALGLQNGAAGPALKRLKAVFIAELRPIAPPDDAPRVLARPPSASRVMAKPALVPASAAAAASAPGVVDPPPPPPAEAPLEAAPVVADAPLAEPPAQQTPEVLEAVPPAVAASAPAVPVITVDWPRSTQLTYTLTGHFRGPVEGQAAVQWLREGSRYQVHLEVSVGSSLAPLVSRRMSSDGEIGPDGLTPRRYEEETRVAFREPRRLAVQFDGPAVRLANGTEVPRPAGVQDTASQFVQMTWLFTTQPDRLRSGQSVDLMLALPRRVEPWTYDVLGRETLHTPVGPIDAVHVRPRRPARAGDLTAEMWTAPSLQYLPVRIVIRQDGDNWVDLLIDRLPVQAAESAPR